MKKPEFTKILLPAFPILTVFVASAPNGVMVFDGTEVVYQAWMQTVAQSSVGWCAPVAALLNYVLFGLAVIYLIAKKTWSLKPIFYLAVAATCIASLPVVSQGDVKVIPSALGIIFLAAEAITAAIVIKKEQAAQQNAPKGKRLEPR